MSDECTCIVNSASPAPDYGCPVHYAPDTQSSETSAPRRGRSRRERAPVLSALEDMAAKAERCDRLHCNDTIGPCDACPLIAERERYRKALQRIAGSESGHWGVIAYEALRGTDSA